MFVGFKSARSRNDLGLCPSNGQLVDDFFEYGLARRVSEQNPIILRTKSDYAVRFRPHRFLYQVSPGHAPETVDASV